MDGAADDTYCESRIEGIQPTMCASLAFGFLSKREPSRDDPSSHCGQQWEFRICCYSEVELVYAGEDELRRPCSMARITFKLLYSYISPQGSVYRRRAASIGIIPGVRGVGLRSCCGKGEN